MKYMLMMHGTKSAFDRFARWSKQELETNHAFMGAFTKELKDSGVFVSSEGLGWPHEARLVCAGSQGEPISDGVFPESREFLARYWIVDVETPEQAVTIAAQLSQALGAGGKTSNMAVELRPLLSSHSDLGL